MIVKRTGFAVCSHPIFSRVAYTYLFVSQRLMRTTYDPYAACMLPLRNYIVNGHTTRGYIGSCLVVLGCAEGRSGNIFSPFLFEITIKFCAHHRTYVSPGLLVVTKGPHLLQSGIRLTSPSRVGSSLIPSLRLSIVVDFFGYSPRRDLFPRKVWFEFFVRQETHIMTRSETRTRNFHILVIVCGVLLQHYRATVFVVSNI